MQLEGREIGRYRVISLIGHGGMGYVYLAEDPRIQQQVAIKVLHNDVSPASDIGTASLALFRGEARVIAQLKHPRIVHLNYYDEATIDDNSIIYLVTPFYKDGSLAKWLQEHGTNQLSLEDVTHFINQAADALQYAHNFGIVHRDVKPSNFLIDTEGITNPNRPNLLLTDFGIAKFTTGSTTSPALAYSGGLAYMAPEQFNGQDLPASDQYALAIIAYELFTGHPPFQGVPQVIMRQHFNTQPDPPSSVKPNTPKVIDTVILRALAKKPEDRFGSIEAFAAAFQRGSGFIDQPKRQIVSPLGGKPDANPPLEQLRPPIVKPAGDQPNVGPPLNQPVPPKVSSPPPPKLPRGKDIQAILAVSPTEAQRGTNKVLVLGSRRRVTIPVPPNAYNGMVIHMDGLGEPSPAGGLAGTLHVTISFAPYQAPPLPRPSYHVPPPPMYSPPQKAPGQMMAPPPPPQQKSNRTLWLVLGIIGGVILVLALCTCALIVAPHLR